ncbi:hypothetical protein LXL04_002627 [Taraxacum kok-saghyz]
MLRPEDESHEKNYQMRKSERKQVYLHEYTKEYYGIKEHGQMVVHQRPQMGHWIIEAHVVELEALVTQMEEEHARLLKQVDELNKEKLKQGTSQSETIRELQEELKTTRN